MGTASSPVKSGWIQVTHETVYAPGRGYGWQRPAEGSFNDSEPVAPQFRSTHPNYVGPLDDPALRDGVEDARPLTFLVDLPPGRYWVSATVGRYRAFRHDMNVRLNGLAVATNIDAWGYVWGSQGGTPTKTVAALAEPAGGQLRLDFECATPQEDRWMEYSDKSPEGGKLWFLGENKNSVVAIRIRPAVESLLRLEKDRINGTLTVAPLEEARTAFNAGNDAVATTLATNVSPSRLEEWIQKASLLDCMIGSMRVQDRTQELLLLDQAIPAWKKILELLPAAEHESSSQYWLAVARLESAQRYRQALGYIGMLAYTWADKQTGLNKYHRYWAAYDLCGAFTPEDPLYFKSHLLRGRVAMWNGHEGGWKHCYALARQHFDLLHAAFPENRIVRMYRGERVPTVKVYPVPAPEAPEWARLQYEALQRYLDLIHYWVDCRQSANGELGGNWGDDVEILRGWLPAALAIGDPLAQRGLRLMAEGVWHSGEMTDGYSSTVSDVEHGAELMSDTHPLMCLVDYGDPVYLERCMATMRCMRDVWTAVNSHGHRHFRSHNYSATVVDAKAAAGVDVALNGRATNPGIPLLWYNGHPAVQKLIGEWSQAWIEDAFRTDGGKPRGFVPGSIRFDDDRLGGFADAWWQTRGYFSDFESVGYTQTLYDNMLAMFAVTRSPLYMSNLFATVEAVEAEATYPSSADPPGSAAWAAKLCDCGELADVIAKWRQLTGQTNYDAFLRRRGSPYARYLVTGDSQALEQDLRGIIAGLSANIEMSTSEVLFTDRVSLPGNEVLFEMMSGSVGTPTYYPMHAVTWQNTSNQLAILVEHADSRRLDVSLFNFAAAPLEVEARPWRLAAGEYEVRVAPATATNISSSADRSRRVTLREPGEQIKVTLPARQLLHFGLVQTKALPPSAPNLPDLALGSDAIEVVNPPLMVGRTARLRLTLHNLGLKGTQETPGEFWDGPRRVTTIRWPALAAPLDLVPRQTSVEVEWRPCSAGSHLLRLVADPKGKTRDAVRLNNQRSVNVEVRS